MADIEPLTEDEKAAWPTEVLVKLEKAFTDERGAIQPLVDMDMKSAVLITSNPGAVRANHYHKTGWHFCYVIEGEIEYYHRPAGSDEPPARVVAGPGRMIFTPPMVENYGREILLSAPASEVRELDDGAIVVLCHDDVDWETDCRDVAEHIGLPAHEDIH